MSYIYERIRSLGVRQNPLNDRQLSSMFFVFFPETQHRFLRASETDAFPGPAVCLEEATGVSPFTQQKPLWSHVPGFQEFFCFAGAEICNM